MAAQECATSMLASSPECQFPQPDHPRVTELLMEVSRAMSAVNFVCRDHVEGFIALVLIFVVLVPIDNRLIVAYM